MRNLFKLKDSSNDQIKNLKVGYDLSEIERDLVRQKIEEAKQKSTPEVFMAVRGNPWNLHLVARKRLQ